MYFLLNLEPKTSLKKIQSVFKNGWKAILSVSIHQKTLDLSCM